MERFGNAAADPDPRELSGGRPPSLAGYDRRAAATLARGKTSTGLKAARPGRMNRRQGGKAQRNEDESSHSGAPHGLRAVAQPAAYEGDRLYRSGTACRGARRAVAAGRHEDRVA